MKEKDKRQHTNLQKFYTNNKFKLLIDLRSIASQEMHAVAPISLTPQMASSWNSSEMAKEQEMLTATSS